MRLIDDIPFYAVIIGFLLNIFVGIVQQISFKNLMIRSIIVTLLFSVLGYLLSTVMKSVYINITTESGTDANENSSIIDIRLPPMDEHDLLSYDDDEFIEMNPANLNENSNS